MRIRGFVVLAFVMLVGAQVFAASAGAQSTVQRQYDRGDDGLTAEEEIGGEDRGNDDLAFDADRAAGEFSCAEIVEISRSASRHQYNFSSARLQECLAREVVGETKGRLADTGGPPLLPMAAFVLVGAGIFMGRAVLARRDG